MLKVGKGGGGQGAVLAHGRRRSHHGMPSSSEHQCTLQSLEPQGAASIFHSWAWLSEQPESIADLHLHMHEAVKKPAS